MVTYLLLRDNKQLGPLTLDEVIQMGLKGYDLVWVEGKSAAWRYPSEIEELKSFAPIVEEQPFDRFYKRPVAEIKNIPKEITPVKTEAAPVVSHEKQYATISRGDNKVYVTLPARTAATATSSIKKNPVEEIKPADIRESFFNEEKFAKQPAFGNEFLRHDVVENNQGVEKTQQLKISSNKQMWSPVLMLLGVFVLLGCGILIGLYINKSATLSSEKTKATADQQTVSVKEQQTNPTQTNPQVVPVSGKLVDNNQNNELDNSTKDNTIENKNVAASQTDLQNSKKESTTFEDKKPVQKTKNILPKKIPIVAQAAATDTNSDFYQKTGVARRSATHRTDEISDKVVLKTNIADMVGLTANNYSVGTFGGISNLQITVSNHSVYPLDLVVVEVHYVQANKKIFKTENVYFHNVGAGSALMQEAPKSPRGIKVQYKIAVINSKDSGLSYSGN
jgi:hypothetical protein